MAKVKEVYVHKNIKLGKSYNSSGLAAGVTISLEDGDSVEDVLAQGWEIVDKEISEQIVEVARVLDVLDGELSE